MGMVKLDVFGRKKPSRASRRADVCWILPETLPETMGILQQVLGLFPPCDMWGMEGAVWSCMELGVSQDTSYFHEPVGATFLEFPHDRNRMKQVSLKNSAEFEHPPFCSQCRAARIS